MLIPDYFLCYLRCRLSGIMTGALKEVLFSTSEICVSLILGTNMRCAQTCAGKDRKMEENQKALDCGIIQGISNTKEKVSFSRLECIYAYLMFAIGFCFMRFVLWNVTGIFTTIFFIGTAFVCLYYLKKNNYKFYNIHKIIFGLIMIFSLVFSITANSFIKSLDIVFLLMLGSYWVYAVCKENKDIERFFFFDMLKAVMVMPFLSFGKTLR